MEFTATPTYDDDNSNQSQATEWLGLGAGVGLWVDAYYYLPSIQYLVLHQACSLVLLL